MSKKLIIAHRGDSHACRENTIEAIESAIRLGVDAVEIDVQQTADERWVCYHDDMLPILDMKPIKSCTLAEVKQVLKNVGVAVPTLQEVLEVCRDRVLCDVELKSSVSPLMAAQTCLDMGVEFQIKSFSSVQVQMIKEKFPKVTTALVVGMPSPEKYVRTRLKELFPVKWLEQCKADQIHPHWKLLRLGFLGRMVKAKKPVWVWCIDDPKWLTKWLQEDRIAGIITNEPHRAIYIQNELLNKSLNDGT